MRKLNRKVRPNFFGKRTPPDPMETMRKSRVWRDKFNYYRVSEGMPRDRAQAMADASYLEYQERKRRTAGKDVAFKRNARRHEDDPDFVNDEILAGVVEGFWLPSWADAVEEAELPLPRHITIEVAPEPPNEVNNFAYDFGIRTIEVNGGETLDSLYEAALEAPGRHSREPTPREFGYYLAMEAQGHGVSWADDHPEPLDGYAKVPNVEFYVTLEDPNDEDSAYVDFAEIGR